MKRRSEPVTYPVGRWVFIKATVLLLLIISAAILVSATITWHLSLDTTTDAFNGMSKALRHNVMESSIHKVKDFLSALSVASFSVFKCLEVLTDVSPELFSGAALRCMWGAMSGNDNIRSISITTHDPLVWFYRRYGPEAAALNTSIVVSVPSPSSDLSSVTWVYAADPVSGQPLMDRRMLKACIMGQCPAGAGNFSVSIYGTPLPPLKRMPMWVAGAPLRHGEPLLRSDMGLSGNWQPLLMLVRTLRDPASNDVKAVLAISNRASMIIDYLLTLPVVTTMHGVAFITTGPSVHLVSTTHGSLVKRPGGADGSPPPHVPATESEDVVVSMSASHMNATFGALLWSQPCDAVVPVAGRGRHYVDSRPLTQQGLTLTIFLAVPVGSFRADIDASVRHSLYYTILTVLAILVAGLAGILLSTVLTSRVYRRVARHNQRLQRQLAGMVRHRSGDWSNVDMGTASEKLHTMIRSLQGGALLSDGQVALMRELVASSDMHQPQCLREVQDTASPPGLDHETGAWLDSLAAQPGVPPKPAQRLASSNLRSLKSLQTIKSLDKLAADELMISQGLASSAMSPAAFPVAVEMDEEARELLGEVEGVLAALGPVRSCHVSPDDWDLVCRMSLGSQEDSVRAGSSNRSWVGLGSVDVAATSMSSWSAKRAENGPGGLVGLANRPSSGIREQPGTLPSSGDMTGDWPAPREDSVGKEQRWKTVKKSGSEGVHDWKSAGDLGELEGDGGLRGGGAPQQCRRFSGRWSFDWSPRKGKGHASHFSGGGLQLAESHKERVCQDQGIARDGWVRGAGLGSPNEDKKNDARCNAPRVQPQGGLLGAISQPGGLDARPPAFGSRSTSCTVLPSCDDASSSGVGHGELLALLRRLGSWGLDALAVSRASQGRPILYVGYLALHDAGLVDEFRLPKDRLLRFLQELDRGMDPEALYHSTAHIADVTGSLYHLLFESGVGRHLRRVDQLAAMVAALVHDYKHPGVNNEFILKNGGKLAMKYNDRSPLENFHLSEAFELVKAEGTNFLQHLGRTTYGEIRHIIIEMVLATDLKRHFRVLDAFKARLLTLDDRPWDPESESDRLLLLRMALKVADLGHTCKSLPLHRQWTSLIIEEFYTQGDAERAAGLDVSPFMDRAHNCVPTAQTGFIHFIVHPLVYAWVKAFPQCRPLLENLMKNAEYWKQEQDKQGHTR